MGKIYKASWIAGRGVSLYPFGIFVKSFYYNDIDKLINHEKIHWQQQKEMFCIFFYLWYGIEWMVNIFKYGKKAYIKLSFEQEAYYHDDDLLYLSRRKRYSWIEFLKFKPIK